MPKYTAITSKSIEYEYDLDIVLPLDMGAESERLTDLYVRKGCENGSLSDMIDMQDATKVDDNGDEKLIALYRGDKQIWPRPRKKKLATKASEIKFRDDLPLTTEVD